MHPNLWTDCDEENQGIILALTWADYAFVAPFTPQEGAVFCRLLTGEMTFITWCTLNSDTLGLNRAKTFTFKQVALNTDCLIYEKSGQTLCREQLTHFTA